MGLVDAAFDLDEGLRALSHPARREILTRCTGKWVAAGDLASALDLAPATTSEHLKVLRKSGLVELEIDGTWRRYRTVTTSLDNLIATLSALYPNASDAFASKEQP
jgi:DNA-binding transcriptional ArsR family regulator